MRTVLLACVVASMGCGGLVVAPGEPSDAGVSPTACPAPSETTLVVGPGDYAPLDGLVAWGGNLYFGATTGVPPQGGVPSGRIFRVGAAGGAPEPVASGYVSRELVTDGVDLFFAHGVARPSSGGSSLVFPGLRAAPLAGGAARDLERPVKTDAAQGLKPAGRRGVIYDAYSPIGTEPSQHSVVRWDGRAMTVLVVSSGLVAWEADETDLYWMDVVGPGPFELHRQPLDGVASTIATSPKPWAFVGHDATNLYVSVADESSNAPWGPGASVRILRVPKAGGPQAVIASGLRMSDARPVVADGYLYFASSPDSGTIERLPTGGGVPEVFAEDRTGSGYVDAMAADACSLYWIASNPGRVLRKAR